MSPVLVCYRGLPGSGKSTAARAQLGLLSEFVRVNRDDIRESQFDGQGVLSFEEEGLITQIQRSTAGIALDAGRSVIVDDTNLRPKYLREWDKFAISHGAEFETREFNTDLEDCVRNDFSRMREGGRYVGDKVIRDMAAKYMPNGSFLPYTPYVPEAVSLEEPYLNPRHLPHIVIVDIDGTMALMGTRKPYDWKAVSQDAPNWPVVRLVQGLVGLGTRIVFLSGRDGSCRFDTLAWLQRYIPLNAPYESAWELHMRDEGDSRKDSIVKREIFDREIRDKYHVQFVLDDRNQVVQMWRSLGLPVFQVADGDF